jgi:hypothetical protein
MPSAQQRDIVHFLVPDAIVSHRTAISLVHALGNHELSFEGCPVNRRGP